MVPVMWKTYGYQQRDIPRNEPKFRIITGQAPALGRFAVECDIRILCTGCTLQGLDCGPFPWQMQFP